MVLNVLFKKLGVVLDDSVKAAIAALCYSCLLYNECGVTEENKQAVKDVLRSTLCSKFEFEVFILAAENAAELEDLIIPNITAPVKKTLCSEYIWPFLQTHEVFPGVLMK